MRVIYMYHQLEPVRGSITAGNLPDPAGAYRGYRSLFLTQTPTQATELADSFTDPMKMAASAGGVLDFEAETATTTTLELRNVDVVLPSGDDTLYWCKMFKLADIEQKSHVIKVGTIQRYGQKLRTRCLSILPLCHWVVSSLFLTHRLVFASAVWAGVRFADQPSVYAAHHSVRMPAVVGVVRRTGADVPWTRSSV